MPSGRPTAKLAFSELDSMALWERDVAVSQTGVGSDQAVARVTRGRFIYLFFCLSLYLRVTSPLVRRLLHEQLHRELRPRQRLERHDLRGLLHGAAVVARVALDPALAELAAAMTA